MPKEKGDGTHREVEEEEERKLQSDTEGVFSRMDSLAKKSQQLGSGKEINDLYSYPDQILTTTSEHLPKELKHILQLISVQIPDNMEVSVSYSLYIDRDNNPLDHFTISLPSNKPTDLSILNISRIPSSLNPVEDRSIDSIIVHDTVQNSFTSHRQTKKLFPQLYSNTYSVVSDYLTENPYNQLNILSELTSLFEQQNKKSTSSDPVIQRNSGSLLSR